LPPPSPPSPLSKGTMPVPRFSLKVRFSPKRVRRSFLSFLFFFRSTQVTASFPRVRSPLCSPLAVEPPGPAAVTYWRLFFADGSASPPVAKVTAFPFSPRGGDLSPVACPHESRQAPPVLGRHRCHLFCATPWQAFPSSLRFFDRALWELFCDFLLWVDMARQVLFASNFFDQLLFPDVRFPPPGSNDL